MLAHCPVPCATDDGRQRVLRGTSPGAAYVEEALIAFIFIARQFYFTAREMVDKNSKQTEPRRGRDLSAQQQ